jgi:hypothetical protein
MCPPSWSYGSRTTESRTGSRSLSSKNGTLLSKDFQAQGQASSPPALQNTKHFFLSLFFLGFLVPDSKSRSGSTDPTESGHNPDRIRHTSQDKELRVVLHLLVHVAVHGGYGEVPLVHLLCEPVHLPPRVAEDHSLVNQSFINTKIRMLSTGTWYQCSGSMKFWCGSLPLTNGSVIGSVADPDP